MSDKNAFKQLPYGAIDEQGNLIPPPRFKLVHTTPTVETWKNQDVKPDTEGFVRQCDFFQEEFVVSFDGTADWSGWSDMEHYGHIRYLRTR